MKEIGYLERCFARDLSIVSRKIVDGFVLVPIRRKAADLESIYTMNEVGGRIWELVDGERHVWEMRDMIVEEFQVGQEEAEEDLREFLKQLEQVGAVKEV
jgi:hypothetical protein